MEKCKTKLVPKIVANQNNFTKKFIKEQHKKYLKKTNLEKEIKQHNARLVSQYTKIYCNPGCKGTVFQGDDFDVDVETFVKKNICKKDPTCDAKSLVKIFKKQRKNLTKNRKRILTDDSFYYAFANKTKKAKLIKDGALSGCAVKFA